MRNRTEHGFSRLTAISDAGSTPAASTNFKLLIFRSECNQWRKLGFRLCDATDAGNAEIHWPSGSKENVRHPAIDGVSTPSPGRRELPHIYALDARVSQVPIRNTPRASHDPLLYLPRRSCYRCTVSDCLLEVTAGGPVGSSRSTNTHRAGAIRFG